LVVNFEPDDEMLFCFQAIQQAQISPVAANVGIWHAITYAQRIPTAGLHYDGRMMARNHRFRNEAYHLFLGTRGMRDTVLITVSRTFSMNQFADVAACKTREVLRSNRSLTLPRSCS
jgi:hypothetical protein